MIFETVAIPLRLRGKSTTTYASSKLNRVGRRAARYDSGLLAHKCNRPAHKRLTPHRIAYGQIACSRSRCGNLSTINLSSVNIHFQTFAMPLPPIHNHARYDALNRLATMSSPADASGCYGLTWTYDAWGNRIAQTTTPVTGGSCVSPNHAVNTANRIIDTGYVHDSAGNMTNDNINAYTFDAEDHLTSVNAGSVATYVYDADGKRVRKISSSVTTDYVYDGAGVVAEIQGSIWTTGYVHSGGALVVQYNGAIGASGATALFAFSDHLGSTRVMTTVSAGVSDSMDYLPYGELLSGGGTTTHKFTAKERDTESGLDYFGARYFGSNLGRFSSPDPLLNSGRPDNPQTWNRYTYTMNNPLNFTDPTGLYVWSAGLGGNASDAAVSADILDKRKHFESALSNAYMDADGLSNFDQWADAIEALDSYGQKGEANGVTVGIDTIPGDSGAYTHVEANNQVVVAIAPGSFGSQSLPELVAHEGKHVEDAKAWIGCGRCDAKNPSTFNEESAGYEIAGLIAAGHFERTHTPVQASVWGVYAGSPQRNIGMQIWNASWGMVDYSRGLIKQAAQNVVKADGEGPDTAAGRRPAFPGSQGQWQ